MYSARKTHVAVLGGGVTGLTVANTFQAAGAAVKLLAETHPFTPGDIANPLVPTFYAGAILYPDRLPLPGAKQIVSASSRIFTKLATEYRESAVYTVKHCVLGNGPLPYPDFPDIVQPIEPFSSAGVFGSDRNAMDGYCYQTQLAELPDYVPWLRNNFIKLGGRVERKRLIAKDFSYLKSDLIINCLGYGAEELYPELSGVGELVRGSVCYIKDQPLLLNSAGERITYQYRPPRDIYWNDLGEEMFVYAYPRSDGMLLGGVREPGRLVDRVFVPRWEFEQKISDGESLTVPEPVFTENKRLLKELFDVDIDLLATEIRVGYRYSISEANGGARLGFERSHSIPTMHCIGWGPSGVTYSWGCALKLLADAVREGILTRLEWSSVDPVLRSILEEESPGDFNF